MCVCPSNVRLLEERYALHVIRYTKMIISCVYGGFKRNFRRLKSNLNIADCYSELRYALL